MGYVGVSSINLIFIYGSLSFRLNPIQFIHSWLLIQSFQENIAMCASQVGKKVYQHFFNVVVHQSDRTLKSTHKTALCETMSLCHQINNECWVARSKRTRKSSSRVTGSHTLGKQLEASLHFTVLQHVFLFLSLSLFFHLHTFPVIFLQGPAACLFRC